MRPRKLVLDLIYPLGDAVILTAAVRDLHRCHPGRFITDVRCCCPDVWRHNPLITPLDPKASDVEVIDCHCPQVRLSNRSPLNTIQGFTRHLGEQLGVSIESGPIKGEIYLSKWEKRQSSPIAHFTGEEIPYWVVSGGGKSDVTIKWWSRERYQGVIDHFAGKIQFVQIGANGHWHPRLDGVIDLRGRTSVRELIRLIYRAQGVLCPTTSLMHLAAAVETPPGEPPRRACVVVAGGREPPHWAAYPHHQFVHTLGSLPCCSNGGCWRSRTRPLGLGDDRDEERKICLDRVEDLPRCMHMISAEEVSRRIEFYFQHRGRGYLTPKALKQARRAVEISADNAYDDLPLRLGHAYVATEEFLRTLPSFTTPNQERGIVLCASNRHYLANAWVCIRTLRHLGCQLPIELWGFSYTLSDPSIGKLMQSLDVQCVAADSLRKKHPTRRLNGRNLKWYAMTLCNFEEALYLDADIVPLSDPTYLFAEPAFQESGALCWLDSHVLRIPEENLNCMEIPYRAEPAFDTGQFLIDRRRHWRTLNLARWFDAHADFFHRKFCGDNALQIALWKVDSDYTTPDDPPDKLDGAIVHHDLEGRKIFQHRSACQWSIERTNPQVAGFEREDQCLKYLREFANEAFLPTAPRPAAPLPVDEGSEVPRFWHVYHDPEASDIDCRSDQERRSWATQYAQERWRPFAFTRTTLTRVFRDEDRRMVYLSDLVDRVCELANRRDVIVLTTTGVCAAPTLNKRLRQTLSKLPACYAYHVEREGRPAKTSRDDRSLSGRTSDRCGLVAFSVAWWLEHGHEIPDVLFEGEWWDLCLRAQIKRSVVAVDHYLDNVIFHQAHSCPYFERDQPRPSQAHDALLAQPFLEELGNGSMQIDSSSRTGQRKTRSTPNVPA